MTAWRTIDSAPKDGTAVLLYGQREGETPFVGVFAYAGWGEKEWVENTTGLEACRAPHEPTHWMPLPDPPND